jgi:hypothetical protein
MGGVVEEAVEFYDVGVVQEHLYLDLLDELFEHVAHLLFRYLFYCDQHAGGGMQGDEDLSEGAFALALAQNEVGEANAGGFVVGEFGDFKFGLFIIVDVVFCVEWR